MPRPLQKQRLCSCIRMCVSVSVSMSVCVCVHLIWRKHIDQVVAEIIQRDPVYVQMVLTLG